MNDIFGQQQLIPMTFHSQRALKKVQRWGQGIQDGRSTGFSTLDPYLRLTGGELTIIAARPSQGKTSLAMQMVENVAHQLQEEADPGCVAVYSAEMAGDELVIRMASALCGVNAHHLRQAKGQAGDAELMQQTIRGFRKLPIWIDDSSRPSTARMLESLSLVNQDNPIRMMMFDFVELGGDDGKTEEQRISSIYQHLKGIAKTLDIPVLALSQLNRDVEKRADRLPSISDLRGSGMGEQIADRIALIMRPEYYFERGEQLKVPEADKKGIAYIQIAKNRNGPVGLLRMGFRKERSMFHDLNAPALGRTVNSATAILQPPAIQREPDGDILYA